MTRWFAEHGRDLLWRHDVTPYRVWVSEIMLQQTQVATVTPYFERWMQRFPTIEALATAEDADVLTQWQGLGYYRRARYLHQGAQYILAQWGGQFPKALSDLQQVPGIGAYTAGAIASIAFGQNVPAIDGNAERVLGRYFAIDGDLKKGHARRTLEDYATRIAETGHAAIVNQAIMDLGASLCGKKATCDACPLAKRCQAKRLGLTDVLPQKAAAIPKHQLYCAALFLVDHAGQALIARRRADQLLGGLWTFPMIELMQNPKTPAQANPLSRSPRIAEWSAWLHDHGVCTHLSACTPSGAWLRHIFTHIDMRITLDHAVYPQNIQASSLLPDHAFDAFDTVPVTDAGIQMGDHPSSTLMKKLLRSTNVMRG